MYQVRLFTLILIQVIKKTNTMKKIISLLIINLLLLIFINNNLSYYGKGVNIFNHKLLYGYNTDYDPLEGFKIEDDEFLQVFGSGSEINQNIKVKRILRYAQNNFGIFSEFLDLYNKKHVVKITYSDNRELGHKLKYSIITNVSKLKLNWYNVNDSYYVRSLEVFNMFLKISFLLILFLIFYKKIKPASF